ncbi:DUF4173 domain-containing protein [Sphingomonadaceae bacterium]|nr:DUF4173 domain-containing protein [Sphingomonadaceae bacterium]
MLFSELFGPALGVFALLWISALAITRPAVRKNSSAGIALACAAFYAIVLIDDPSLLAWLLFMTAIGTAALLPRSAFDHSGRWAWRLIWLAVFGLFRPIVDLTRLSRLPSRGGATGRNLASLVALPLIGGAVFIALFANANPVLSQALSRIRLPDAFSSAGHIVLWGVVLVIVWPTLRPRTFKLGRPHEPMFAPTIPVGTLVLTLITFNAIFAIQNVLDIVFLWSGAALPEGVTLADYAHRGAYTLIATALLAAGFVLVTLHPGSAAANRPLMRKLLILWIAQNILLVASSILRLFDYIEAYSMTVLRLSAFAWMVLVAIGLVLICWRLLAGRSAGWLINANSIAAAVVLSLASVVDLGAVSAAWNVRETGAAGGVDLCYLNRLGPSALIPLIELESSIADPERREQVTYLRHQAMTALEGAQSDWRSWSWRGARRYEQALDMLGSAPERPRVGPHGRKCDGSLRPPPEIAPPLPSEPDYPQAPEEGLLTNSGEE